MSELETVLRLAGESLAVESGRVVIRDEAAFRGSLPGLVEESILGTGPRQGWARFLVRGAALSLGVVPSSIHELYLARGRGDVPRTFTVPAMNLRALSFEAAKAVFRVAKAVDAGAFIFEIARSEIGYTDQKPAEYATNILGAAIAEGWTGPVFIQGDHFQLSPKKYSEDPDGELDAVKKLARDAMSSGFFNIDVDCSTLVDVSMATVPEQQELNVALSAELSAHIREHEPANVTVSIGGEIGEVGGHNSTADELQAYMEGYNETMSNQAAGRPGLSKISIQTGTSHGGTVLPDGSLAQVNIDFRTLKELSTVARSKFGLGGAVQHGASTLPEDAFHKFVEYEAVEVHLATSFMTMFYENCPADLRKEMYAWLDKNASGDRKQGMTDEQFYYKARKRAIGPFKRQTYGVDADAKGQITAAWEKQFAKLFDLLGVAGTRRYVEEFVRTEEVAPESAFYAGGQSTVAMAEDLQD